MSNKMQYHTGWYVKKNTAIFQFEKSIDNLSCELIEYTGLRETTKKEAKEKLNKIEMLKYLNKKYPKYHLINIKIE